MQIQGKAQNVIDEIHESVQRFARRANDSKYIMENQLITVMCRGGYNFTPDEYARRLNAAYGYNMGEYQVIKILNLMKISNINERLNIFQSVENFADAYSMAITGSKGDFTALETIRRNCQNSYRLERIAPFMIYTKYPELDSYGDFNLLMGLGKTLSRYYFYTMYDALCHVYGFPMFVTGRKDKNSGKKNIMSLEQAVNRVEGLEAELERTKSMLVELQEEFDNQLQESKVTELTDFFANLNSDKYGNILDQLLQVRRGIDSLKTEELPVEINGLFIMVKQLIKFTRDRHIEPIMRLHSRQKVTAKDIEFCDYEGTPFSSNSELKTVEIISPGWVCKDYDVRISRPRVRECEA